jgi:hypothetical protein
LYNVFGLAADNWLDRRAAANTLECRVALVVSSVMLPPTRNIRAARDLAIGIALAVVVLLCPLVISGHVPARGLVTGTVYEVSVTGKTPPAPDPRLVFQQAGSWMEFIAAVNAAGHYSATLPPGRYHIVSKDYSYAVWQIPGQHPDPVSYDAVLAYLEQLRLRGQEPVGVTVVAGEHEVVNVAFLTP